MMTKRPPDLERFVECLKAAFIAASDHAAISGVVEKVFWALKTVGGAGSERPSRRDVCRYLPSALDSSASASEILMRLGRSFSAIDAQLRWLPRPASGPNASANWAEGHANTMIIGPGGLEQRKDVAIGASLLAPHVRYPDHDHEPEEIYLVMTPGRFQHGTSTWFTPGAGGTVHNIPGITHAMESGEMPLLAFWCLLFCDAEAA